ncbi:pyruvate:ferredoxin (flavodoxin) oxidoreductase [Lutispora saccharofermentans]|uniref:Pyruvate:ferredoxin oxidoreductase n=1 Tax=Lutispora saccharofermentans TaxID=3024236 RepID=A0ABT1NBU6_9FIRM|nr:pyruvate:ferredoxin (flavodoxin) oxidoreductase [Lutispora saccharofermentans]MCQ1528734.1 pyruvate:ferredoxin (flavodoxin) oxidoreductase [Lutispora saccharofermentans]
MTKRRTQTMDGNTAAAYASYAFTDVAAIYPITPSSPMAGLVDDWSSKGKKNIFGETVFVKEMQSEGGAAGTLHGALQSGALTTTYTASQGLLLMIPNMYKIAGELLPAVFHVSARSLASNSLSIFGDHQDVMSTRQTGFTLLASSSVQQAMDLGAVAHLSAIKSRLPVLHFFDGFRTSHEVQKIEMLEYDELEKLVDFEALKAFRNNALSPNHPVLRGTTQNPDVFFQLRESVNKFHDAVPEVVQSYMDEINKLTGRNYRLFNYYGAEDAENIIIAMGSGCETISEVVDYLNSRGEKAGLLEVHLYRPFAADFMLNEIPKTVKKIAVLDRTKEPGANGEPLYLDVKNAFYNVENAPLIVGGRYGLGSKDFKPDDALSVFNNLKSDSPKNDFTVSIVDDVTNKSLPLAEESIDTTPEGTIACKFWGYGSDGTVSANKSAIKIIGDNTDFYAQAYFEYDAKKSGGLTISHLRFGKSPIKEPYAINRADFIACHNQAYVNKYDLLSGIKKGGKFLLNCIWSEKELEEQLPASMKRSIADNDVEFYIIDAVDIAKEVGLGGKINMIMQAAFFKLAQIIPVEDVSKYLKKEVEKSYGNKGQNIVDMNYLAIDKGFDSMKKVNVPESWKAAVDNNAEKDSEIPEFVEKVIFAMNRQEGDKLPVSAFLNREDGSFPLGVTAWEKREIAIEVPQWDASKCIQCNQCSFVCPHAVIRPTLLTEEEMKGAPEVFKAVAATGLKEMKYHLAISAQDCTGCGSCVNTCPAKEKAIEMKPLASKREQYIRNWNFAKDIIPKDVPKNLEKTVKGSQFKKPLLEFSGACAGCGETPYAKLVTQMFGDRMMISNAAGCSTVWGGSPQVSYTTNHKGHGPSWGFSLFEDNAEYGFGMYLGVQKIRNAAKSKVVEAIEKAAGERAKEALQEWLDGFDNSDGTRERADKLIAALEEEKGNNKLLNEIYDNKDYLVKRSHWIFGGDGWAYDIGYGGLDHVLASGENVNVLVFDTEVYSNTGGQSSKSTPTAAIAEFAASGKRTRKKDLGMMAMSYGYVYVAQIAMGADRNQTLKAIIEAENYPGPSLIIAYSPCINHGIKVGMGKSQMQEKEAVESGYWTLYRYNPQLEDQGKNPFVLDSKEPAKSFKEFLMSEVRYASLYKLFPEQADELFAKAEADAKYRYQKYVDMARLEPATESI